MAAIFLPVYIIVALLRRMRTVHSKKPRLVWGPVPIINNKYWSNALRESGFASDTLMQSYYAINKRDDFDYLYEDFCNLGNRYLNFLFQPFIVYLHVLTKYDIAHISFHGGFLQKTALKYMETFLYKLAKMKLVVIPYGSDYLIYSKLEDPNLKHVLLTNYPESGRKEKVIVRQVSHYSRYADFILAGFRLEHLGRWDMTPSSFLTIDTQEWKCDRQFSDANGKNKPVKIIHAPNHRGFKGTEFLVKAIDSLIKEGYKIDFKLIENMSNEEVKTHMQNADILAEQFVAKGHGLNAVEGMALSLPVLANLTDTTLFDFFRNYSHYKECPIVAANVMNLKEQLVLLIESPILREELGLKGRSYVEKYHGKIRAQLMFSKIYEKIWDNSAIDLINYFHPILGQYQEDYKKYVDET